MADINKPLPFPEPKLPDKPRPPLPCPDPVPEVPMRQSKGPGILNRLWANRLNLARHFISEGVAGVVGLTSMTLAGAKRIPTIPEAVSAFVAGGVYGMWRKDKSDTQKKASGGGTDTLGAVLVAVTAGKLQPKPKVATTQTDKGGQEMDVILNMLISNIDSILVMLNSQLAVGKPAEKHVGTVVILVLRYEPELRAAVLRSTNTLDDKIVEELMQAAKQITVN